MKIQSIFSALGIDYHQFRTLLKTHILLDFRSSHAYQTSNAGSPKRRLIFTILFYLIPGLMIALFGVKRCDLYGFSFLTIAVSMIFIILSIIIEFNEIIMNPSDAEILTFRPIDSKTYFWVKMANLIFYVTIFGLALSLPPAFIGLAFPETNWLFVPIYILTSWIAQITVASFVIIFYTFLVRILNYERMKDVLVYVQVIFTFFIFAGYQFLIRFTAKIDHVQLEGYWNVFVPPAWFGSVIAMIYQPVHLLFVVLTGLAIVGTLLILRYAFQNLSLEYAQLIYKLSQTSGSKEQEKAVRLPSRKRSFNLKYLLVKVPSERIGFDLISKYLKRDRLLRTRIYPSFAMPLVIMVVFILDGEFQDPFLSGTGFGTLMPLLFLIYVAVFFYQIVPTSNDWKASWIYYVAPIENFARIYWGAVKAILLKYITPYFIVIFLVLLTQMSAWHAFLVCIFNYFFFVAYYLFMTFFLDDLPLSKKFERGQSNTRFMLLYGLFPLFIIGGVLEYLVFQFPVLIPIALIIFFVSGWIIARYSGRRFDERIRKKECYI